MSKKLTISVPDETYDALRAAARAISGTPEEIATNTIKERYGNVSQPPSPPPAQAARATLLNVMRAHGHLVEPHPRTPITEHIALPRIGSPERKLLEEEIANELSDALDQTGWSLLDLIDRR